MKNNQLGFRGVRSSKFRHVYGSAAKRERCYDNIKITKNAHDSHFCAVNPKFVAVVTEVAGGGAFLVLPITQTGRLDLNASKVTGHKGPVLDIKWNPFNDNIIASCSDDCTVKLWYIPDGGLTANLTEWLIDLHGHKRRVGYVEFHPTAENVLVSAGFDHLLILWDVGKGEAMNVIDCHPDVIYSMSFNRDGSRLATTCKDKKLRIIDPRTGFIISEGTCHAGTRSSKVAYLGGTGRVVTTGFSRHSDRQVSVWNDENLHLLHEETIDSSSGVIFPYYDPDTNILFLAGKGDGNIRYYEIVDQAPYIHFLSQYISGSPQRGLGFMPKRGCDVSQCEIFRFYKLHATRGMCEPVSMIVPRKSDQFQEDLYPDTTAAVAALTAADWRNGMNRAPVLMSMKTGVAVCTHKPQVFKGTELSRSATADNNYRMKYAFLSNQTTPDYRPIELLPESEKLQKTSTNQSTKFQQIQTMFTNFSNQSDIMNEDFMNLKIIEQSDYEDIPKTEYALQRAYLRQREELRFLRKQLASRDRQIKDLEQAVAKLQHHHRKHK
ncbi:coronin-2B-like isoform X2 [Macrosteles quadrilineatus]|uniref:coronin-2B-like isoform X2 n=1 Tax=Macrosteles quadrilineatus TaxID=74068 RepID=UPI0023E0E622|nr:coronin-2B-like isoform X2 [Macrosteles quadrilineatus]